MGQFLSVRAPRHQVFALPLSRIVTFNDGTEYAEHFLPGDWMLLIEQPIKHFMFMQNERFRRRYSPHDDAAQREWDVNEYDVVVDEEQPIIPLADVTCGRRYLVVLQRKSVITPNAAIRGRLLEVTQDQLIVEALNAKVYQIDQCDIAYVVQLQEKSHAGDD